LHQPKSLIVLSLLIVFLSAPQGRTQEADPAAESGPPLMRGMSPDERRAAYEALSEEDKQIVRKRQRAARDQQRAEWEAMTPEEREVRREEMRTRAEKLTPEQREAVREAREKKQQARRSQSPPVLNEEAAPPETDPQ